MIILNEVAVRFEDKTVLDRFSLKLPEEGTVCITGPSGCGKTTLLNVIAGIIKPESGSVTGMEQGQAAVMFQDDRLLPWRTALENIEDVLPGDRAGKAKKWLESVELGSDGALMPDELSGGMRRRVALARALAYRKNVLVLDEPFKGVDHALRERMMDLVKRQGGLTIMATHDEEEMRYMGGLVLRMSGPPLRITD